ncbi:MAG: ferrochelatase [Bacteroidota bacterium]
MSNPHTGVLIMNLGTPDSPNRGDVYKYLKQFLLDPRVLDISWLGRQALVRGIIAPFRSGSSGKLYKEMWDEKGSPLKYYGESLVEGVQSMLGEEYHVELAMRYQSPSVKDALDKIEQSRVDRYIIFPLFPHYASASTGSAHEEVMQYFVKKQVIPDIRFINSYYDNEDMIKIFARKGKEFPVHEYDHILFSFHGLPERQMIKQDIGNHCQQNKDCCKTFSEKNKTCYSAQCYVTAKAIAKELNLDEDKYTVCFQSRLGRAEWVKPYTTDILKERAEKGDKKVLAFCPAFTADCLETIIEMGIEYTEEWEELGGETFDWVRSLNDDPEWVETVAELIKTY